MPEESSTVDTLVLERAAKLKESSSSQIPIEKEKIDLPIEGTEKKDDTGIKPKEGEINQNPYQDLFKELGVESLDALKEKLKPKPEDKPESPEEKEKRESIYQASIQKYAVENGEMKLEDFSKLESLKGKEDQNLVFENWLSGWKEENPDVDPAEADRLAKEEFESEYKLNSENEKAKARGIAKIAKEAKEIRGPLEKAYKSAKENYDEVREGEAIFPEFNKKVTGFIKEHVPEKYTVFKVKDGEEEVPIDVDLTPAERVEILNSVGESILRNKANYDLYKKGDFKALQDLAKEKTESLISNKYRDTAAQKIAIEFLSRGTKKGSTTGSKNPFPLNDDGKKPDGEEGKSAARTVLDSLRGKK